LICELRDRQGEWFRVPRDSQWASVDRFEADIKALL